AAQPAPQRGPATGGLARTGRAVKCNVVAMIAERPDVLQRYCISSAGGSTGGGSPAGLRRRARKNARRHSPHASASTPPSTRVWWLSAVIAGTSSTPPQAPVFGSLAPYTTRARRA